ncbi:UNVERIFIED_CONTAM: hypothetical protein GTU68_023572 [Idotea baltica]|nr:hypothetical protein [Idotea baltica]
MVVNDRAQVTAKKPQVKSLLVAKSKKLSGRSKGTISIRHRGGGTRSFYRKVDFSGLQKKDIPGTIKEIEYDPNRTAYIALVFYKDGDKRYVLAHKGAAIGDEVLTTEKTKAKHGMRMQLKNIPVGFPVFNIEFQPGKGGQIVRSAGGSAKLISLDGDKAQIVMPSGETRLFEKECFATIGILSNEEKSLEKIGKAGRVRNKGRRPQVRGKVMNPNDHPHGGGEGASSIGMKYPKTPWGAHALGVKTRKNKSSNKLISISRHRAKQKSR